MMLLTKPACKLKMAVYSVFLLMLSGCYDPYYVGGDGYQSSYGGTAVSYQQPWYDYDYYPSAGVYFNPGSGYYYHHDHGRWNHVRRLPRHIRIHDYDRVRLRLHGDRPYLYHDEHRRKYSKYKGYRKNHKQKYRDDRYSNERKYERRDKREYKDERKHDKRHDKKRNKRSKHASGKDDRDRSADRHRRDKKEEKQRKINDMQRKTVEKQQERERRRKAVDREIDAIETRVYGGGGVDSRNSGWTIQ